MTQQLKNILKRMTKQSTNSTIAEQKVPTTSIAKSKQISQKRPYKTFYLRATAAESETTTAYPVQKDMILFETLDNIHALFSIPQKN